MEALCLLRAMEAGLEDEFVEEVDQPIEARVEKKEPRKEGLAGGCGCGCGCGCERERGSVVVVVQGLSISTLLVGS